MRIKQFMILILLLGLTAALLSCGNGGGGSEGGEEPDGDGGSADGGSEDTDRDDEGAGVHWTEGSDIYIITTPESSRNLIFDLQATLAETFKKQPKRMSSTMPKEEFEIILGRCSREASRLATEALEQLGEPDKYGARAVAYAYNNSIAFVADVFPTEAFNTIDVLARLVEKFIEEKLSEFDGELKLENGIIYAYTENALDILRENEAKNAEYVWNSLQSSLSKKANGDEICEALKSYYSVVLDDELYRWFAGLYDPKIGGYYYSNSARDNEPHRPDAESTSQALEFMNVSGLTAIGWENAIPEEMKAELIYFIKSMQDPNGYFYHPQWSKELTDTKLSRKSRDLASCVLILQKLGKAPTYDTPTGVKGDGTPATRAALPYPVREGISSAVSRVVLSASYDAHLMSESAFRDYLDAFIKKGTAFYAIGNEISAQMGVILARDKELTASGAGYSLVDILIEWLNAKQNPENGCWGNDSTYDKVNGMLKIASIYKSASRVFPNADAAALSAIEAMLLTTTPDKVTDVYNTWYALVILLENMRLFGGNEAALRDLIYEKAPAAIRATASKLCVFKKSDGSYSYYPEYAAFESQGMLVAEKYVNEGDVNATCMATTGTLNMIRLVLNVNLPTIYGMADLIDYLDIIDAKRK